VSTMTDHNLGRNDPCRCGSGRKYKHCCLEKDEATARAASADTAAKSANPEAGTAGGATKHQTYQPWRKSAANTRGFHRISAPRKVGGG
jgi:hypothetical protein